MSSTIHHRYFVELAYHGGNFHGWQIQQNALTVQEVVDEALSTISRQAVNTTGCGRTDTGVHALQLYAHFDLAKPIENIPGFLHQLNSLLPGSIAAKSIVPVDAEAHARFDATRRRYEYHIHKGKNPFLQGLSWQIRDFPDVKKMNEAAQFLLEYRDFSSFSKSNTQVFTNNCTIFEAYWEQSSELGDSARLIFQIEADRFLRNMVRAIVGTLLDIGLGKNKPEHIRTVIESKNRSNAGASVPPDGLYLSKVEYPKNIVLIENQLNTTR